MPDNKTFWSECESYVAEVEAWTRYSAVSRSHTTLRHLYNTYGRARVQNFVDAHIYS